MLEKLSIGVRSRTRQAKSGLEAVREKLGDLRDRALSAGGGLSVLSNRADEAGDELDDAARNANQTSRSFAALSVSGHGASLSVGRLTSSLGLLVVSLGTLSTMLAPITAGFLGVSAAVASVGVAFGALLGAGLLAWGQQLADQMEGVSSATEALSKIAERLRNRLVTVIAPLGESFVPLLKEATLALPGVVEAMVAAVGSTERFRTTLREFGGLAADVLPGLTAALFGLARRALPPLKSLVAYLGEKGPSAVENIRQSITELRPEFREFLDAAVEFLPVLLEFGTNVADVVLPALSDLLGLATKAMSTINGLPGPLQDAAIAGLVLAPVLFGLSLKLAGIVNLLTGGGGLIALVGGSSGIGAAIAALTGPIGIAVAAVAFLGYAWATNMWDIRQKTSKTVSFVRSEWQAMKRDLNQWESGDIQLWPDKNVVPKWLRDAGMPVHDEQNDNDQQYAKQGKDDAKAYRKGYQQQLEKYRKLFNGKGNGPLAGLSPDKKLAKSWLNPETFEAQGETSGKSFARGFTQAATASLKERRQEIKAKLFDAMEAENLQKARSLRKQLQQVDMKTSGLTPTLRKVLKQGVPGYKSKGLVDKPTAISQKLFEAVSKTDKGATPSRLGVSQQEFQVLMQKYAGGSSGGRGPGTATGAGAGSGAGAAFFSGAGPSSTGGASRGASAIASFESAVSSFESAVAKFSQAAATPTQLVIASRDGDLAELIDARLAARETQRKNQFDSATGRATIRRS